MPRVVVERVIESVDADLIWSIAKNVTEYPRFMEQVVSVDVVDDCASKTSWIVLFNGNELRWIETDDYDEERRRVTFEQVEGDLAAWSGFFEACPGRDDVTARYEVVFDLGIPALADLLHPLGEASIRANCEQMLEEIERQGVIAARIGVEMRGDVAHQN